MLVIGAGVAGLSCAAWLSEAGLRVTVLDGSAVAGGRARSWSDPGTGDTVDIGPHVLLDRYANFRSLLKLAGTEGEIEWLCRKLLTVQDDDRAFPVRTAHLPAPFHWLPTLPHVLPSTTLTQLMSNVRLAWDAMRDTEADFLRLDNLSGREHLLSIGVHPTFVDWFWESAALALLNVPLAHCSAAAIMRLAAHMLGQRDVCFGIPRLGLSELYVPGCERTIEDAGGSVRLQHSVRRIERAEHGWLAVLEGGRRLQARHCVLALPPDALRDVLPFTLPAAAPQWYEPSPYISCYLWFDRKLTDERFWARPWTGTSLNMDFYAVSEVRRFGYTQGSVIASNIIWSHRAADLSDEAIVRTTLDELAPQCTVAPHRHLVSHALHRIPMSVPASRPGAESRRPGTVLERGLYLAGDWTRTQLPPCMESAARSGALAAEAVLTGCGREQQIALPPPVPDGLALWLRKGLLAPSHAQ